VSGGSDRKQGGLAEVTSGHGIILAPGKSWCADEPAAPISASIAAQVKTLAKARRLSANRMLLELIENGMEAEKRKQQEFFGLAERFRNATDPKEIKRLRKPFCCAVSPP
jgi:hypothetical protein